MSVSSSTLTPRLGGGKGSWSAWKAGELARRYEAQGGGYLDKGDHKNKSKPGVPEKKEDGKTKSGNNKGGKKDRDEKKGDKKNMKEQEEQEDNDGDEEEEEEEES
jgi:hypothetical protein